MVKQLHRYASSVEFLSDNAGTSLHAISAISPPIFFVDKPLECSYICHRRKTYFKLMRKKILVVDDDPLYLELVSDVFAIHDIDVLSAPNGNEALTLLNTFHPVLIVSDFDMPGMSGMELHSKLLQNGNTNITPFVFMTGSADQTLSEYTKRHGLRLFNKNNIVSELFRLSAELKDPAP
jgi:CheY-like chemotaxis protein